MLKLLVVRCKPPAEVEYDDMQTIWLESPQTTLKQIGRRGFNSKRAYKSKCGRVKCWLLAHSNWMAAVSANLPVLVQILGIFWGSE